MSQHQIIGAAEIVDFPEFNWLKVRARIDTGARTSAMHCTRITLQKTENGEFLHFWLQPDDSGQSRSFITSDFEEKKVKSSFGTIEHRFTIKALLIVNHKKIRGKFTLTNREKMSYPVLIGRNFLRNRFLVDVSRNNVKVD